MYYIPKTNIVPKTNIMNHTHTFGDFQVRWWYCMDLMSNFCASRL